MRSPRVASPAGGSAQKRLARRVAALALSISLGGIAAFLVAAPYVVAHQSMFATLRPGELLLVDRLTPSFFAIGRGSIIVFHPPFEGGSTSAFVKRVVGVSGDTVLIEDGEVFVDGYRLREPYLAGGTRTDVSGGRLEVHVRPGTVFVLGDNRPSSWDSRGFGLVPLANVIGLAWLGYDLGSPPDLLLADGSSLGQLGR